VIGTDPVAVRDATVRPDMVRVEATGGVVGSDPWVLTALLPAGYPLTSVDRRAACFELVYRGEASNGTSCVGHPSWVRLGGQIFAVGEVPSPTSRVRVTLDNGPPVDVDAVLLQQWAATRFWVTP